MLIYKISNGKPSLFNLWRTQKFFYFMFYEIQNLIGTSDIMMALSTLHRLYSLFYGCMAAMQTTLAHNTITYAYILPTADKYSAWAKNNSYRSLNVRLYKYRSEMEREHGKPKLQQHHQQPALVIYVVRSAISFRILLLSKYLQGCGNVCVVQNIHYVVQSYGAYTYIFYCIFESYRYKVFFFSK